jgi:hypothetical protein
MIFEWDPHKARSNRKKHRLEFDEAASVFLDPMAMTYQDPAGPPEDRREITIGYTIKGNLVFVSHCERGTRIRIISARLATRAERKQYEESA